MVTVCKQHIVLRHAHVLLQHVTNALQLVSQGGHIHPGRVRQGRQGGKGWKGGRRSEDAAGNGEPQESLSVWVNGRSLLSRPPQAVTETTTDFPGRSLDLNLESQI